ncbi:PAS domain S-box protein [Confluentibacter citreus]|uniref:PAS domain S-box protein n=1 Tax=Confluentibacter citreus TaxID=2007307 RepID=UPI000C285BAD|nr:PAS domain S-box protein [Confluentibacter citreus]
MMRLLPQFDHIFQFLPRPSLILLPDAPKFTIVGVNDSYLDVVNSAKKDLIGKGVFEAFPENPEDKISNGVGNLRNSLNLVISQNELHKMSLQKYDIPIRGTSKFKVKYFNPQNIPIKDDNGNITHILHSVEDVTDKKKLELSLAIERQRFNDLYFQAPSCMGILKGPNYVYELANPLYLELIGAKDIIGKTVKEVLPELETQGIFEILDNVYKTGETFLANEMLVKFDHHKNGELVDRYLDFNYQANRDENGTINGILFFASDVTELVLARKKVEESKKRYKELIENLPVATYSCDLEGRILLYNKAAVELWGREPDTEKDKWGGSVKVYSENGNPIPIDLYPMVRAVKEGRKINDQEIIIENSNGDKRNILPNPVPFFDSSGRVTGAVNVLVDITNRKRAELKLIKSEKRLNQAQETAHLGNWELNFETGTCLWSSETCKIFGLSPTEHTQSYASWLSYIHEKDKDTVLNSITESHKTLNDLILNYRITLKDGTVKFIHGICKFEFDTNQKPIGLYGTTQDVTERKKTEKILRESEKKYRQIVETAQEGIWVIDEHNITTFVNNKLCDILGFSKDEMMGKDIYFFMDDDTKPVAAQLMQNKKNGYADQKEFKYISKSGKDVWTHLSSNPLFNEAGIYKGRLAMVTDITERKNTDEKLGNLIKELAHQNQENERKAAELCQSNKELVKTNKELDSFVYSVSHDLRSPLTSILGLVSFIEEDSKEPDTIEQVKMIRTSINRLDGFIKNILNYSQNNRTELEIQNIHLKKTIHDVVESVHNMKEADGISFKIDIKEQHPFYSDWQRFNTVVENLVSNAIKYHSEAISGRYIKLTGTSNKEELKLSISDNGMGIAPEFHDKIFEMFYRLPGNTIGSGIGLYIVKETVDKMHGTIEIESKKGVGTTFNITLKNLKE